MNTKQIIAAPIIGATFFIAAACGTQAAPPAQDISIDKAEPREDFTPRYNENNAWQRNKGPSTGAINHPRPDRP